MYDIEELERKWIKYRRRKIVVIASSAILASSIIGGVSYLIFTSSSRSDNELELAKKDKIAKDKDIIVKRRKEPVSSSINTEVPSIKREQNRDYLAEDDTIEQPKRKVPKMNMVITEPENGSVIKEIEDRFSSSKNYDDAIYLAQYYYNKKNYKKAEYWAMQANIVDSIPEESWIIFAKAKAKSGHRVEALKVLEAYYSKTGSTNALDLIDAIRKNENFQ